jgi:hypothetical protein
MLIGAYLGVRPRQTQRALGMLQAECPADKTRSADLTAFIGAEGAERWKLWVD